METSFSYPSGKEVEVLTAAKILPPNCNGMLYLLDRALGFTVTLPRLVNTGKRFVLKFIVKTAPASGTYVITESAAFDTNKIITNGINELEVDTGDDGPSNTGHTTITFADGVAIAGDWIVLESDGVNWYCTGQAKADGGITLA
jgi:hypothetical protein